jgi:signal transduction histidine kinase
MTEHAVFLHEIKNSLNAVYGLCDLIQLSQLTQQQHAQQQSAEPDSTAEYCELMKKSIDSIKNIEKDYSEYIKTGRKTMSYSIVDVAAVVREITDVESKKAPIKTDLRKCRAYTDANKLKQVVVNLISNAEKYGNGKEISVSCYTKDNAAVISIEDHGIGMTKEQLAKIGTPFYRCKKIEAEGTGLGISFVKKTCNLLGWDLSIASELNRGTTATISIKHIVS